MNNVIGLDEENQKILEEDRIGDALGWMRNYYKSHPTWKLTLEQISKLSKRFRVTEGCVLRLYERLNDEMQMEAKILEVIHYMEQQSHFGFY